MKRAMRNYSSHKRMTIQESSLPAGQADIWQLKNKLLTYEINSVNYLQNSKNDQLSA